MAQLTTVASSLARAKVWEECHYDQFLTTRATMIPSQADYGANLSVNLQGVVNAVPLQNIPQTIAVPYSPYFLYQKVVPAKELSSETRPKDPNDALLITLTKKMEELAINLAKDKKKRHKPTNMHFNVWCSNCKGQLAEDKGLIQRDSSIHHVEVVNAVLIRGQQKDKNPIQDLDEPIVGEQVAPSTGLNEPISVLGCISILRPQETEEPNLVPRANLSKLSRSIPIDQYLLLIPPIPVPTTNLHPPPIIPLAPTSTELKGLHCTHPVYGLELPIPGSGHLSIPIGAKSDSSLLELRELATLILVLDQY
uniref:Predicted protein n=1 Tax=Physcomitrium patens TaxID=3218 RepID=A9U2M0_PHYPA